jgi:membrane protease YdiL (CAAX protease family)
VALFAAAVFIVGLLFGIAWARWRNLPVLIAVHWGIDLLPSISSFLMIPPTMR